MKLIKGINNYKENKKCFLTIGTFDGIHQGHQKIIKSLVSESRKKNLLSVVLTFSPHPRIVLQKDTSIKLIDTIDEKISILKKMEVDVLVIHPFSISFSKLGPMEFTQEILVKIFKIHKLFIGFDHRFGKNREASVDDLIEYGPKYNFKVKKISAFEIDKINISSTKIRNEILKGNLDVVNKFLGRPFILSGNIKKGDGIGRKINFPTANLEIKENNKIVPAKGVYIIKCNILNTDYLGMMNIGNRPTLNGKNQTIEIHFFNFNRDIYELKIQVFIIKKIRDEIKFSSLNALKNQLKKDKIKCINISKESQNFKSISL
ncbi:MAG: bifunctional riboflavin kinase/FAD synthetase [Flavobacteriaceae bacterium]